MLWFDEIFDTNDIFQDESSSCWRHEAIISLQTRKISQKRFDEINLDSQAPMVLKGTWTERGQSRHESQARKTVFVINPTAIKLFKEASEIFIDKVAETMKNGQ